MSNKQQLPCIDCITLAICKGRINRDYPSVEPIARKCRLISDYIIEKLLETKLVKFYNPPYLYSTQLLKAVNDFDEVYKEEICRSAKDRLSIILKFFNINYTITILKYDGNTISTSYSLLKNNKNEGESN